MKTCQKNEKCIPNQIASDCGTDSEVPFEPKPDRPVYCPGMFNKDHRN